MKRYHSIPTCGFSIRGMRVNYWTIQFQLDLDVERRRKDLQTYCIPTLCLFHPIRQCAWRDPLPVPKLVRLILRARITKVKPDPTTFHTCLIMSICNFTLKGSFCKNKRTRSRSSRRKLTCGANWSIWIFLQRLDTYRVCFVNGPNRDSRICANEMLAIQVFWYLLSSNNGCDHLSCIYILWSPYGDHPRNHTRYMRSIVNRSCSRPK